MVESGGKLAAKMREAIAADQATRPRHKLAKDAGIDRKQLYLFMLGRQDMTLTVAAKLCEQLGLELRQSAKRRKDAE